MKILIVEDDPSSLKLTSEVVQGGGHVVMLATSADHAIYSIKAVKPDVILLDLRLPGIEGLGVAHHVREEMHLNDIAIIAITSSSEEYGKEKALQAGCDAYFVKPINTRTLVQNIEDAVAAKSRSSFASGQN